MKRILIVGRPDLNLPSDVGAILAEEGDWGVDQAPTCQALPRVLALSSFDLVLVLLAPRGGHEPPELFPHIRSSLGPSVPIVAVLPEGASEAELRHVPEVADLLVAPLRPAEVRARIWRLLDRERRQGLAETCARVTERLGLEGIVGEDPVFVAIKAKLPPIARAEATVLISGETGTGKEVIARAIHYLSRRTHAPFLPVNCGAIPTDLFENELFGHRRGAFTDARTSEGGLIAEAEGGTLFLDEVDAIPLPAQVKLLGFLQHRTFRPLGSPSFLRADVRIIAATNADLEAKVKAGGFREDLYYRLNIIPIALPPLRDRKGDIALLARHFLEKHAGPTEPDGWQLAPEFFEALEGYAWPGNVRELENLIQQIVALNRPGPIGPHALPARFWPQTTPSTPASFREAKAQAVAAFEREYARRLLAAYEGNVTRAARAAKKDRRAFGRLVQKHGIERPLAWSALPGRLGRTGPTPG